MTIKQLRDHLSAAVTPVFTDDFAKKYNMIASQNVPGSVDNISDAYKDDIDSFIRLAEYLSGNPAMLKNLGRCVNPLVAFGVFIRYDLLTQLFIASDQSAECDFVSDKSKILTSVLIDKWESHLSKYRRKPSPVYRWP